MGHIHKYSMHCLQKKKKETQNKKQNKKKTQSAGFIYCCCCWAVIVRYVVQPSVFTDNILVSKTVFFFFFKNVCVAGMAVRLNMSPASLCSHVHKSTYNDCKPKKTHIALRNPLLPTSDRTFSSQNQWVAPKSAMVHFFNHYKQHGLFADDLQWKCCTDTKKKKRKKKPPQLGFTVLLSRNGKKNKETKQNKKKEVLEHVVPFEPHKTGCEN